MERHITRNQFKNALKRLATIKGGKVTEEQKASLDNVLAYVGKFFLLDVESGLFYIYSNSKEDHTFHLSGAHPRLVEMLTDLILGDEDAKNIIIESLNKANEIAFNALGVEEAKITIDFGEKGVKIRDLFDR